MKKYLKNIAERFLMLVLIPALVFAVPVQGQKAYAASGTDISNFDYSLVAPQSLETFALYHSSQNFKVNEDTKWTKVFDSSYGPCDGGSAYMVFKAPEGKKFKSLIFETQCAQGSADVYAYTDINDLSTECKLTSTNQNLISYLGAWTRMKKLYTLFPDNTQYVKIEFSSNSGAGDWGRHINNIGFDVVGTDEAMYGDMSIKEEFGTDLELYPGDGYIYERVGMSKSPHFTGNGAVGNIIARSNGNTEGDAHLIFQAAPGYKMKNFTIKAIMIDRCEYLSFYYSETADGEYKKLPMPQFAKTSDGNWDTYVYSFDKLPKNTRYIKVCVPKVELTWFYLIDNFSSDWAKLTDDVSEMNKSEYEYLSEKEPARPTSGKTELTLNINAPSEYVYTNVLGERVVMAPKGKKFASFTYSSTTNNPGTVYCSQNYTDGFVKAKSFIASQNSQSTCYYIDFLTLAQGTARAVSESVLKSSKMPFNTHYVKITDTSVSNFTAVFADDDECIQSGGTAENFSFYAEYEDDPYILDFGGLSKSYIRETYTIDGESRAVYGALTVKEVGTPGYVVFGAPDNAAIEKYTLYVRNSGSNISPLFYSGNSGGGYAEVTASKEQLDTKLYSYTLSLPTGTEKVKIVLNGIEGDEKERFKLVGYSFDWSGNTENGNQSYKEYNITLNSNETAQTVKGWGVYPGSVFPVDKATDVLRGTERNEVKDALYRDLGVNTVRFELYSDYDRTNKKLTDTDNISKLVDMIKGAQSYGLDYILTIWTAPASLKTNGLTLGYNLDGTDAGLIPGTEEEFCEYIKIWLDTLVANGCKLPLSLSFTNEAEGNASWQACHFETAQYVKMFKLLSKKLDDSGYSGVKLHGSEAGAYYGMSTMFKEDFSAFDDAEFNNCFDILAYHAYGGINTDAGGKNGYLIAKNKIGSREIWQTEFTSIYDVNAAMNKICRDTRLIGSSRWFWWTGFITSGGGLIEKNEDGYVYTNIYKMLRAVYNGVPAGSKVCDYTFDDVQLDDKVVDKDIVCNISTFKTPNGSAVVLVNNSECEKTYNISGLDGSEAKVSIYNPSLDDVTEKRIAVSNSKIKKIKLSAGESMVLSTEMPKSEISYSVNSDQSKAVADVTLRNQKDAAVMLTFAGYKGNTLVNVQSKSATLTSDKESFEFELPSDKLDRVRMYVWKSQSMEPLTDFAPYSITH